MAKKNPTDYSFLSMQFHYPAIICQSADGALGN